MEIEINRIFNKYRLFMYTYWAFMLSIGGMYTMYIVEIGFSKMEMSIAVSIFTFSTLLGQNLIGFIADYYKCIKRVLLISISIGVAAASVLIFSKQVWVIYSMIFLWGAALYGTVPLSDVWFIRFLKANGKNNEFGKIRGLGSLGYAVSGVFLGFLLQKFGWSIYIFYILISACFLFLSIFIIADTEGIKLSENINEVEKDNGKISFKEALSQLIAIKPLRSMIIILFMYFFVVKGIYSYLAILLSDTGGGPLSLGVAYFFDASPEIITFFLASRLLTRFKSKSMIFASFIIQIVRLSLILIFNSPLAIILLGMLSGFAYGLQAAAYKTYIYDLAPKKYKVSCLSISEAIISFSGVFGAPVFGFVIMKFGTYSAITAGLLIDISVAIFMAVNMVKEREKNKIVIPILSKIEKQDLD